MMKYKNLMIAAGLAFVIGLSMGGSVVYKWALSQEAGRLKVALELADQEKQAALASLKTYYESLPPVEVIKTEVKHVIKNLAYDPKCRVTPDERRVLDYTRTGVRTAAGGADESNRSDGATEAPGSVSRKAEVLAHVDAATRYRQCFALAKAIQVYEQER